MLIKRLYFKDYQDIKKLITRNNLKIPSFFLWKKLWNNSKINVGDGIFYKNKLIGYHAYFKKKLKFKNKTLNMLVSSSWAVDKKYRKNSIILLNNYFNKKSDIFLTTTANNKVSKIWKSFGAFEINSIGCKTILFKILNPKEFLKIVFLKKKIKYPKIIIEFFTVFLKIYLKIFKNKYSRTFELSYEFFDSYQSEISKFNKLFERNIKIPHELRTEDKLKNYLDVISDKKKVYFMLIRNKNKLIGYAILVKEKINNSNIKRINLGQLRILDEGYKNINEIFEQISYFANKKMCALVEFRNLNSKINFYLNKKYFIKRNLEENPYLIILKKKKRLSIKKYTKKKWDTSYIDGDCMI